VRTSGPIQEIERIPAALYFLNPCNMPLDLVAEVPQILHPEFQLQMLSQLIQPVELYNKGKDRVKRKLQMNSLWKQFQQCYWGFCCHDVDKTAAILGFCLIEQLLQLTNVQNREVFLVRSSLTLSGLIHLNNTVFWKVFRVLHQGSG
jgi:hypothetical protein